jgi:hypothetical protein
VTIESIRHHKNHSYKLENKVNLLTSIVEKRIVPDKPYQPRTASAIASRVMNSRCAFSVV